MGGREDYQGTVEDDSRGPTESEEAGTPGKDDHDRLGDYPDPASGQSPQTYKEVRGFEISGRECYSRRIPLLLGG